MNSIIIKSIFSAWPIFIIIFIIVIIYFLFDIRNINFKVNKNEFPYEKKPFIFDSVSELNLYKTLLELFGDKYHIFTQVNYSHLVRTKDKYDRGDRSRIDKKSADFVLCDKEHVIPILVIELDGFSHKTQKTELRDAFVNKVMTDINFPILHLENKDIKDKEFIMSEINKKLTKI